MKEDDRNRLIKPTIDYLLKQTFASGNLRSSRGSETDKLIHWCHGAPGLVHLLLKAHQVFSANATEEYLEAAEKCGQVIWQRGLLKKGHGLCHGISGNAYAFVALYQATKQDLYLHRALFFAEFMLAKHHSCREADRPYSLFEGMSGTVHFLDDVEKGLIGAKFPAFDL